MMQDIVSEILSSNELTLLLEKVLCTKKSERDEAEGIIEKCGRHQPGFILSLLAFALMNETSKQKLEPVSLVASSLTTDSFEFNNQDDDAFSEGIKSSTDTEETQVSSDLTFRSLAAIIAKNLIIQNWEILAFQEKKLIKALLLKSLVSPPTMIRSTVHVIVTEIAKTKHEEWNDLFPTIRYLLNQCREKHTMKGILALISLFQCMAESSDVSLASRLLSEDTGTQDALFRLTQGLPQFNFDKQKEEVSITPETRCEALKIYLHCLSTVIAEGLHETIENFVLPRLQLWFDSFVSIINEFNHEPMDLDSTKLGIVVLKCFSVILRSRHQVISKMLIVPLGLSLEACLEALDTYYPFYENMVLNDVDNDAVLEEATDGGPISFIIQLASTIIDTIEVPSTREALISKHVHEILGAFFKFLQLTEAQCNIWMNDVNEFLNHEQEEGFSLELSTRLSGQQLIKEFIVFEPEPSILSLVDAILMFTEVAAERKQQEESLIRVPSASSQFPQPSSMASYWWKPLELALWLTGIVAEVRRNSLEQLLGYKPEVIETSILNLGHFFGNACAPPILRCRALLTGTKLAVIIVHKYPNDIKNLLTVFGQSVGVNIPMTVRLCACKAFTTFLSLSPEDIDLEEIINQSMVVYSVLELIGNCSNESLHLCLLTLTQVMRIKPACVMKYKTAFETQLLKTWYQSSNDALANLYFQELIIVTGTALPSLMLAVQDQLMRTVIKTLSDASNFHERLFDEPDNDINWSEQTDREFNRLSITEASEESTQQSTDKIFKINHDKPKEITDFTSQSMFFDPYELTMALDLLATFLRCSTSSLHPILEEGFTLTLDVMCSNIEDASVIQGGSEVLALFMVQHSEEFNTKKDKLEKIFQLITKKLLSPHLSDHSCLIAGPMLQIFTRNCGQQLIGPEFFRQACWSVLQRLYIARLDSLRCSLVTVLFRFLCDYSSIIYDILNSISVGSENTGVTALVYITKIIISMPSTILFNSRFSRNVIILGLLFILRHVSTPCNKLPEETVQQCIEFLTLHVLKFIKKQTKHEISLEHTEIRDMLNCLRKRVEWSQIRTEGSDLSNNQEESSSYFQSGTSPTNNMVLCNSLSTERVGGGGQNEEAQNLDEWDNVKLDSSDSDTDRSSELAIPDSYRSVFLEQERKEDYYCVEVYVVLEKELRNLWDTDKRFHDVLQTLNPKLVKGWMSFTLRCSSSNVKEEQE